MSHELLLANRIITYAVGEIQEGKTAVIDASNIHLFEGDAGIVYLLVCELEDMDFLIRDESQFPEIRIQQITKLGIAFLVQD